ncbi:lipopolysaccharide-induced tumor necrosis factor-alpha factor homolog [Musca domestica]|uniref:Lipopolysaccharide-induced tumor necrosis factor-alpha factor homolog n=1 Tax=Musca domestica TaxID=7370 RepID=A0A1I8MK67_MUSDO|nr:lipopolysaccharide-induced tumor necrosis factor-alpha factor homolog [Musca domestica]
MDSSLKSAPSPPPYNKLNNIYPEMDTFDPVPTHGHAPVAAAPTTSSVAQVSPPMINIHNIGTETNQPIGPKPVIMTCPQCRCRNKTRTKRRATLKTHLACILLTCCGCCCIPYCLDSCTNLDHFCPTCDAFVGTFST